MARGHRRKEDRRAATLSAESPPEPRLQSALTAEASGAGYTLSNPTHAITRAIAELAELVCTAAAPPGEAAWRDGAALFKALRIAVAQFESTPHRQKCVVNPVGGDTPYQASVDDPAPSPKRRATSAVAEYWHHLHSASRDVTDGKYALTLGELTTAEQNPAYQELKRTNAKRQRDFLRSIVLAALDAQRPLLSENIIRALNHHAIACLHPRAGEYRLCDIRVRGGFTPPVSYRVPELMSDFVTAVHRNWNRSDPLVLATFVLWRLASIHPFTDGNGRTARAASYFVLCVKAGQWIEGKPILPDLIERNYDDYIGCLKSVDASLSRGRVDLQPLHAFVAGLLSKQRPPISSGPGRRSPGARTHTRAVPT